MVVRWVSMSKVPPPPPPPLEVGAASSSSGSIRCKSFRNSLHVWSHLLLELAQDRLQFHLMEEAMAGTEKNQTVNWRRPFHLPSVTELLFTCQNLCSGRIAPDPRLLLLLLTMMDFLFLLLFVAASSSSSGSKSAKD